MNKIDEIIKGFGELNTEAAITESLINLGGLIASIQTLLVVKNIATEDEILEIAQVVTKLLKKEWEKDLNADKKM